MRDDQWQAKTIGVALDHAARQYGDKVATEFHNGVNKRKLVLEKGMIFASPAVNKRVPRSTGNWIGSVRRSCGASASRG